MGIGKTFCRKMSKRSYQYMIRSTYDIMKPNKSTKYNSNSSCVTYSSNKPSKTISKREKKVEYGKDKNGVKYAGHTFALWQGQLLKIVDHSVKMVTLSDGKKRRMSSVEFKHAYEVDWKNLEKSTP